MQHHGVTFHFGSARVCFPSIFETCVSYDKDIWISCCLLYVLLLHNSAISIESYSPINTFYSFIIFSLLINAVILLLNCLFCTLCLHTFSFSTTLFSLLKHYLDLYITDTTLKVSQPFYCFTTSICHGVENYFPRLWVQASLMPFYS